MQFEKIRLPAFNRSIRFRKSNLSTGLNRMNDTIDIASVTGEILYNRELMSTV